MPLTSQASGNGAACPEGVNEVGRVLRIGPGGHLDNDRPGGSVDVDKLAVNTQAQEDRAAGAGEEPELIPVPAAWQDGLIVGSREGLAHP